MKDNYTPIDKMSKKDRKLYNNSKRTIVAFNTGTRIHEDKKHLTRAKKKSIFLKENS